MDAVAPRSFRRAVHSKGCNRERTSESESESPSAKLLCEFRITIISVTAEVGNELSAHNRTIVKNNGIPVNVGQIFDDLAAGDLRSFNALPMDPYGNLVAFSVVVALQYEGFRCLVDYLTLNGDAVAPSQHVPASAAKAAAALVSVAANVTANLQRLPPGDAREEYQVSCATSPHSLSTRVPFT